MSPLECSHMTSRRAILVSRNNETAAMLMSQTNPVEVELFSYANALFFFNDHNDNVAIVNRMKLL